MIEKVIRDYLATELSPVPVYMKEPESNQNPDGDTFVVLEKTGSSLTNFIYTATIAIQSYAPTLYEAAELNEEVKAEMLNIIAETDITRCELISDYVFIKESTKQNRYQAVFDITHY